MFTMAIRAVFAFVVIAPRANFGDVPTSVVLVLSRHFTLLGLVSSE